MACIDAYGWSWQVASTHIEAVNIVYARQQAGGDGTTRTSEVLADRAFGGGGGWVSRQQSVGPSSVEVLGSHVQMEDTSGELEETTGQDILEEQNRAQVLQRMPPGTSNYGMKLWSRCDTPSAYHWGFSVHSGREDKWLFDTDKSKEG